MKVFSVVPGTDRETKRVWPTLPMKHEAMNIDMGRRAVSAFPNLRNCSSCCFQPRTSAFFSEPPRFQSTTTSLSGQMIILNPDHEHFFRYTSGRWLWDEKQQLRVRYKVFNVAELQNLAAKAVRSDCCISITKLAEGGYNKVFCLTMNDGKRVLARIPNPNAGLAFYTTASEVATMELVSSPEPIELQGRLIHAQPRLEISFRFPCLKFLIGVPHQTTPWARNISS